MSLSLTVFIVGFLTVQGVSVGETNNSTISDDQNQESTTLLSFNETQSEIVLQVPLNNDTKSTRLDDEIFSKMPKRQKELVKQFQLANDELLVDDYFRSANFVYGLLSRYNWNVPAAAKSLKMLLRWRLSNKINELGTTETDPELLNLFPYQITAMDRNGCPVFEAPGGKWLIADYMESKEFVRDALKSFDIYISQLLEKSRLAVKQKLTTCNESAAVFLVNFSGWSTRNFAEANALSASVRTATVWESYYPNLFKTVILVNANPDLANFITILTPYFGHTVEQFKVFKVNETEQAKDLVYKLIDPEQLSLKYFDD